MSGNVEVFETPDEAAATCAERIAASLEQTLAAGDIASIAISGGAGPKMMFEHLAARTLPWSRVHVFWVDERCVPPAHSASNYGNAVEALIEPAQIPAQNVHRIDGETEPIAAAVRYASELRGFFGLGCCGLPQFDILHLGMGADAHTASLFPGSALLDDRDRLAAASYASQVKQWRVTLLPGVILNARRLIMLACGGEKAEAVRAALREGYDLKRYPAQLAREAEWFVDRAATRNLDL